MSAPLLAKLQTDLLAISGAETTYATQFVERLLRGAIEVRASDVHLQPTVGKLAIDLRLDGVLTALGVFPLNEKTDVVARLKILAKLLTYRNDVPQEGRIHDPLQGIEMRVSTFPTLGGERAVIRLFAPQGKLRTINQLQLPADAEQRLASWLSQPSGAILLTGPAGSGKSTTAYACLGHLTQTAIARRSILTLEDPIEVIVEGAVQSQVQPAAGFTLASGLRSLLRQDPEVIMVGEVRDRETVETMVQASLTGHLVISTFHAGSTADALCRILDLGIEPYLVRSCLQGLWQQRLLRQLTTRGDQASGYAGRFPIVEMLPPLEGALAQGLLGRSDSHHLELLSLEAGMIPLIARAHHAIKSGLTDMAEIVRVLGISASQSIPKE